MAGSGREKKELHFYPGDKRLLFVVDAKLVLDVDAWGGPTYPGRKVPGEMQAMPTTPGRFRVGWVGKYVTSSWKRSKIRWGARLRRHPASSDDFLYEASPGQWRSVKAMTGATRQQLEAEYARLYKQPGVPERWCFNDFGSVAIRYYEDRNDNHKRDAGEPLSGEMFHATAESEADPGAVLYSSHGCIHLRPLDRDALLNGGAFALGTLVVVHNYGETTGVPRTPAANH